MKGKAAGNSVSDIEVSDSSIMDVAGYCVAYCVKISLPSMGLSNMTIYGMADSACPACVLWT